MTRKSMESKKREAMAELVTACANCSRLQELKMDSTGRVEVKCFYYPGEECENIKRRRGKWNI